MTESILESTKSSLGVCYDEYNSDLVMYINAALADLTIAGAGPKSGFRITGPNEIWSQFCTDTTALELIKQYVTVKVKTLFDPPVNSFVLDALKDEADLTLYKVNLKLDCPPADIDKIWEDN